MLVATGSATGPGEEYALTGHKWFCSAPMSDLFLTLASTDAGLSCFALPRCLPDGTRNAIEVQRLKDKLGNRSNASSEIELDGALARLVGDEGRGIPTILTMVNHTRLDCVIGVVGQMRAGFSQAIHHAQHRSAFGKLLIDHEGVGFMLAENAILLKQCELMIDWCAGVLDGGSLGTAKSSMAKVAVSEALMKIADNCVQVMGGTGVTGDTIVEQVFREIRAFRIYDGPTEVHKWSLAKKLKRDWKAANH